LTDRLRIALAQLNPTVGAIAANLDLALHTLGEAKARSVDILLFSELFLTGYFPEDLLFKRRFVADAMSAARRLAEATVGTGVSVLLPTVWQDGEDLFNAVLLCENGDIVARRYKRELPNDDVFYEKRYFTSGPLAEPLTIKGVSVGVPICEDIWHADVCAHLVDNGARILLCPNGSPYWRNKDATRKQLVAARVSEDNVPLLYLNQVGGQDELVYDGASFAIEPGGNLVLQGRSFESELIVSDWERTANGWRCARPSVAPLTSVAETPWRACVLGLRDYVEQERLQVGGPRAVGRHRQRGRRGHGGRCAWRGEGALPDAALPLHLARKHDGCIRVREAPWCPLRRGADRRAGR
jgi:NAD+ synthase